MPTLSRIFWFREFKKLVFINGFGRVSNFEVKLFVKRRQLIRFSVYRLVLKPYFTGALYKRRLVTKRVWLN